MLNLPDYQVIAPLYNGTRTLVYRAVHRVSEQPVVVKVLRNANPTFNELLQFRNQYTITRHLNSPYVVQPLALESHGHGYALVMPDAGAISLADYWRGGQAAVGGAQAESPAWQTALTKGAAFLPIAIQLAAALHDLSQQRIIHKDIKPLNILIHPETGQVQLIDFSIASLLPQEQQQLVNPNELEGTLAYIAPEQTGRMNRGIDYRADFYALGVTFYELLTDALPFPSDDPMALVHAHLAQMPQFPKTHPAIPSPLQGIVLKLMAKNAEERYQSALGLKHDLERCWRSLEETDQITDFELGQRDLCDRFMIPEKLYGRAAEVQELLTAFERIASPATQSSEAQNSESQRAELLLVAGFSGIGKTAVINEVHKPIVAKRGYFIKGKYDQFNRNIPFNAIVQALRDLMHQLLSESDAQLAQWRTQILTAVGENGQVLIEVIPELATIIGGQPAATELSGGAAQNRFNLLFQKFIAVFTAPEHPLVVFLDDLQWADSASLQLLKVLMGEQTTQHLLLLGAYRDNEVFPAHPLCLMLDELRKIQAPLGTITLTPLKIEQINQLVAETLNCPLEIAQPLTELVYQKNQGNPFFTTQFLKGLYADKLLSFNAELGYWDCDLSRIKAAALTNDVVTFITQQLKKLSTVTQNILKRAAYIGNQFDLNTLAIICETAEAEVAGELWEALQAGVVLPISEAYKFFRGLPERSTANRPVVRYRFLHDRVQQAAYRLIPNAQKQQFHLKIGRLLWRNTPETQQEQALFNIVGQLNLGAELIQSPVERDRLAQLNWQAAQKAKSATAYKAAFDYCLQGYQLLGSEAAWQRDYQLALNLATGATETAYLQANFEMMDYWLEMTLAHAVELLDQIKLYEIKILSCMAKNQLLKSVQTALTVLAQLGIEFPTSPTPEDIEVALTQTAQSTQQYSLAELMALPPMTDPYKIAAVHILGLVVPPTTIAAPAFFPLNITQQVQLCLDYGNSDFAAYTYANYGFLLGGVNADPRPAYQFGQLSLQYQAKYPNPALKAKVLMTVYSFISFWQEHLQESLEPLLEAYQAGVEVGDVEFAAYASISYCFNYFFVGRSLVDLLREINIYADFSQQIKLEPLIVKFEILYQVALNLVGQSNAPQDLDGTAYDRAVRLPQHQASGDGATIAYCHAMQLWLLVLFGHPAEAYAYAEAAEPHFVTLRSTQFFPFFCYYKALAQLAVWQSADAADKPALEQQVIALQAQIKTWATYAPMNYQHYGDVLEAQIQAYVQGNRLAALEAFDRAITGAQEQGYIQEAAFANELAAQFYLAWGKTKIAAAYLQAAYSGYAQWGAKAKTDDLTQRYPDLLQTILHPPIATFNPFATLATLPAPQMAGETSVGLTQSSSTINTALDLTAILKASQNLSRTIELETLLQELTRILLHNSGGDRCILVLPTPEGIWSVQAIATTKTLQCPSTPLANTPHVPVKLIQYVKNTRRVVVVDGGNTELPVLDDDGQQQPQSLLGLPLLNQNELTGILVLENQATAGVFTESRLLILDFLCSQATISLTNAQLHRQEQEKSLRLSQSQERLHVIIQQAPIAIMEWDTNFNFCSWNPAAQKIFGYTPEEVIGQNFRCIIPATSHAYVDDVAQSILSRNGGQYAVNENITKTGDRITCEWFNAPLFDTNNVVYGGLSIAVDITERKVSEAAIERKSQELEQALQELRTAQLQIIQSEKMSALGNLVAGVAHEINNPVGFLQGNIQPAQDYVQDLLGLIELYQAKMSDSDADIEAEIDAIDLDFVREDLPKLIGSMNAGVDRIRNISDSLRIFSRQDQVYQTAFNVHDGLESTLLILKHRTKANEQRPSIQIIKNYSDLPEVQCFPGQLNQVFMNILANAIDAFDDANQGKTYQEIEASPNTITITTTMLEDDVQIKIQDNGCGMKPETVERIFEQGFTTKAVGKGTGLGMAIAHQIITQKHHGTITCTSALGQGTTFTITLPLTDLQQST